MSDYVSIAELRSACRRYASTLAADAASIAHQGIERTEACSPQLRCVGAREASSSHVTPPLRSYAPLLLAFAFKPGATLSDSPARDGTAPPTHYASMSVPENRAAPQATETTRASDVTAATRVVEQAQSPIAEPRRLPVRPLRCLARLTIATLRSPN